MNSFLVYLFWPNPGNAGYDSPKAVALLVVCALLIAGSFVITRWRKKQQDRLRKIASSWSSASLWFGLTGLVMVVSRVEQIQYLSMRILWVVWILALAGYLYLQVKKYRARYYEVLPSDVVSDPRAKYLPKRKRR